VEEKKAKIKEDEIKKYPSVTLNSTYQYNFNTGELIIPTGSFGSLPLGGTSILLPAADKSFELGEHNTFNAGVTVYQPLTQQGKIKTGVDLSKTDVLISEKEKEKAARQITQSVEKLYYGILINRQQQIEAGAKLELAKIKLYDVESALLAGKTVTASKAGLNADVADEEQDLLKLSIQEEDYMADMKYLTGLPEDSFQVDTTETDNNNLPATLDSYQAAATTNNTDINLAGLNKTKTELAIKAAKQSNLPDVGVIAGYTYQKGNALYTTNNPFTGINFKWNLQDIFSNKQVVKQRGYLLQQANENLLNTQEQVSNDVEKAYRKLAQTEALIRVAQKAVNYRKEVLKIQEDRKSAGLNTPSDVLDAKSALAKSEADLYTTQYSYRIAMTELKTLTGNQ
jgi:outer membrane protein TolC